MKRLLAYLFSFGFLLTGSVLFANVPGGGTGTGPNVTLVDNGNGTVTMGNGIVSIVITKSDATIHQINYTYNNTGSPTTYQMLSGGSSGGMFYWEFGGFSSGAATFSIVANTPDYAEVDCLFTSTSSGTVDIHFSMLRGSTGFYVTPIWGHRSVDAAMSLGETRDNIYAGSTFNWMSVDATRNRLMEVSGGTAIGVLGAPVEVSLWTNGIYAGQYEDKYKYSADFGDQRAWGWSSVGAGGRNIGLWNISASVEYFNGGPMKRELMEHIGTTILNDFHGSHFGGGTDSGWNAGEVWMHVYGPYFIYCNNISSSISNTNQAAQALYTDALAQASAEASAWPYAWFTSVPDYALAANRGTVTGQFVLNDSYNPNASASNLWVGVVQQPITTSGIYDFQKWTKPYQFWVKADSNGVFSIPNVIAGANYTLYAFGPGAAGTFQSQAQSGGSAPNSVDIPASPFGVTVAGGATNNLGTVTWKPARVGPTVFEIGYPDRTAKKFRHGEDWWVGDIGPSPANPSPLWSKWLEYPFDFPSGPHYTVGQSRWTTDWNFVQPVVTDSAGNYNGSTSTILFNLASAPASAASLYIATASSYQGPLIVQVNGNNIAGANGYDPAYDSSGNESDATIREGIHGIFADKRLSVSSGFLHAGQNTITINMRKGGYFANHSMYDYIRLELPGYIPPPPAGVTAYAGNNCNLVSWPVMPGATSYNILRSTTSGSGYVSITNGVTGPVCGSGYNNATYVDPTAVNGVTYYYVVQSVNPVGSSANSPESAGAAPSGSVSASVPAAPSGLAIGNTAHQSVTLNWGAVPGANFYTIYRSTLFNNGGGASNVLGTIVLANNVTSPTYTDVSPTDGTIYSYTVSATSAGGTSGNSAPTVAVPLPAPPASAPGSFTGIFVSSSIVLSWAPVPGAVGYIVRRGTNAAGPFTFVMSVTETTYTDGGLNPATTYYYQVTAMNVGGVSANATATVIPAPLAPLSLSAIPGNAQVSLSWTSVPGATGYYLYSGPDSGDETNLVVGNISGTSYINTSLTNGVTYFYVVTSTNSNGESPNSPEASATPNAGVAPAARSLIWNGDGVANVWDVDGATNWRTNGVDTVFNNGDTVTFDNTGSNNVPIQIAGTPQPAFTIFNTTKAYTLAGPDGFYGTNVLIKTGSGTLTINNTNHHSGGTVISNGVVLPGSISGNTTAWGKGPIILAGGTLQFNGYGTRDSGSGWGGCTNTINVPTGRTGTLLLPARFGYASPFTSALTGGGTLNLTVEYVRDYFNGDWSAFTGRINVSAPASGAYYTTGDFRINNANGYANAAIFLNGVNMYNINANGQTTDIGELGGNATAFIGSGGSSNPTWRIGAKNTTNTYAGVLADAGVTSLTKIGTGMLILSGVNNSYSGPTTISAGTLNVINTNGTATGFGAVTVANGGTLAGNGIISGPVTVNSGGTLAPGNPLGTLMITNNLTLSTGSTTYVQVQHSPLTNDSVTVLGTLSAGGTLNVTNTSVLVAGDTFHLFNAGTYSGAFSTLVLPQLTGNLAWNTNSLKTAGVLSVMALTSPIIANAAMSGNNLVLGGSGGVSGWTYYVLASTNLNLPVAQWTRVATNQFDGSGNFSVTNSIDPAAVQTYYQIQLQ